MFGLVTLLGAGPGDEELLTLKGVRRLKEADVLVFDRLINQSLFQYLKKDCERIDVGKSPGQSCIRQEDIEKILIDKATKGKRVVRLKSGDPYIFGRGGEEGIKLVQAGIPFEVVPGITSAIAGLTYAGIPMTYRDVATSFHVFTAHLKDETESLNWDAIARLKGTLVFLMGMKNLSSIAEELIKRGYPKETAAAIIEWGTHPQQRSIDGNLETIVSLASERNFKAPSIIIVGNVVSFRQQLNFYENLPLFGRRILVQQSLSGRLPNLLKDDGAALFTFPARNKVIKLNFQLPDLAQVDGILVTDSQSWSFFIEALRKQGRDLRELAHIKFAALGHHTAKTLENSGILLDKMGSQLSDIAFATELQEKGNNWQILSADYKQEILEKIYSFPVIATHAVAFDRDIDTKDWENIEAVCLPNSLAAMNFVAAVRQAEFDWKDCPVIVMGASSRTVLEDAGFTTIIETDEPTIVSLRDKCREILKQ